MQFQTALIHTKSGVNVDVHEIIVLLKTGEVDSTDIWQFDPGELASISIQSAQELTSWMALRPYVSPLKLAILRQAEKLTIEAQNALLKSMEEPASDTQLVLLTSEPLKLLPTVLSRSRLVRLDNAASTDPNILAATAAWGSADYLAKLKLIQEWLAKNKRSWFSGFIVALWEQLIEESRNLISQDQEQLANLQDKLNILQQLYVGIAHNANLQPALETLALNW